MFGQNSRTASDTHDDSEFVEHIPCEACGSSDANSLYDDGHQYCFSCGAHVAGEGKPQERKRMSKGDFKPITGDYSAIPGRKLDLETCKKFRAVVAIHRGKSVFALPYFKDGQMVGQKVRPEKKDDMWVNGKLAGLFGQQLWPAGGKRITITEGEIDAMSVAQALRLRWPVVSVPNGAQGAKKAIMKELEWLDGYEEIVFLFDMDEAGRAAARECAELFEPGKARIAELPHKDASDALQAGDAESILQSIWNAKAFRPDGIVDLADLEDEILRPVTAGLPWPWPTLTRLTHGRRLGEVYMLGAGTGVGKTDVFTQIIEQTAGELKLPVGVFYMEQKPTETAKRIAGKHAGKRFHVPGSGWTKDELKAAIADLKAAGSIKLYDNFGETDWQIVKGHIRFLAKNDGIQHFFIDHLTAMADPENEKESIEILMREAAMLANELNVCLYMVSHLSTPDGKPHEEGGRVTIRHFKGSRSIGFWSHFMFGLERDQQAEDEDERHTTTFRVLKDRYTGQATGHTFPLEYDAETGILHEGTFSEEPPMFGNADKGLPDPDKIPF